MNLNQCNFIGRLGADPEIRYMPNGDMVANLTIAVSEKWTDKNSGAQREETEWVRIVAFRKLAEIIGQYLKKGAPVFIRGKMNTRKWTDNNGIERYTTEIIAEQMQMLGSQQDGTRPQGESQPPQANGTNYAAAENGSHMPRQAPQQQDSFDDDNIPF